MAGAVIVGAVDIGTNTTRLFIADVVDGTVRPVEARTEITRLGAGVDRTGHLDPAAVVRTLAVLAEYADRLRTHGVARLRVAATSAMRDAADGAAFRAEAERVLGAPCEVLSGDEEARLSFRGALAGFPSGPRTLVLDIGGGSTELVTGVTGPDAACSMDVGSVRLTERHLPSDPPSADELERVEADAAAAVATAQNDVSFAGVTRVVGVAGTVTTVAALALGLEVYAPDRVHRAWLSAETVEATYAQLASLPLAARRAIPVLPPGRADIIVAGAAILVVVLRAGRFDGLFASESDIRAGLALSLVDG